MIRFTRPSPALWLALCMLLGQCSAVVHATEHQAATTDHAVACALCLHAYKTADAALLVTAVLLPSSAAVPVLAADAATASLPAVIPVPAIRGPPGRG